MSFVEFSVNGKTCKVACSTPREITLNAYIRNVLSLSGTKVMCREGGCGICIVSVRACRQPSGEFETFSVNSCMVLVFSCHGWEITTIEGVGNRLEGYSKLQTRMAAFNATQCGFCTPGWIMSLHSLLKNTSMTMASMEKSFGSNTCRCTGYRPILDVIKSFALDASPQLVQQVKDIEDLKICSNTNEACKRRCSTTINHIDDSDWSIINKIKAANIHYFENNKVYVNVHTEEQIFDMLTKLGTDSYMLLDGNTAKCIEESFEYPNVIIDISDVESLKQYHFDQNLVLGANISLEDCIKIFRNTAASRDDEFGYLEEFAKHFEVIAHLAVRNIGSIAGNLMTKRKLPYFQSDVFVLFAAVGAMMTIRTMKGQINLIQMNEFLKYDMKGALVINVLLPPLSKSHMFRSYKVMSRNQNSLAIVNVAFLIKLTKSFKIEEISIVYGNIRPNFIHAAQTEAFLKRKILLNKNVLQTAIKILNAELVPDYHPPKSPPECRKKLAIGLFYKFVLNIIPPSFLSPRLRSGCTVLTRPISHGTQNFQTDESLYPLNEPRPKYEGLVQSSGEAVYTNDIPPLPREVFGAFVLSTIHTGEVDEIDTSVLNMPGVLAIYTANDIPGKNSFTVPSLGVLLIEDEEILVSKTVKYYGQPVAVVVAETEEIAEKTAKEVKVIYKNVSSQLPVLTIDQAKKDSKRIIPHRAKLVPIGRGNNVKKVIKGMFEVEGQYHYYLEPISSVVVPIDQGLEVYDATQWMELTQSSIAQSLGIQESEVVVNVRRLGGGFGGKLSRSSQAVNACALVATKLNRPCRFILPMQTNLAFSGKRLPSQCEYEVGVDDDGKIQYLQASILENKGYSNNDNILDYTANAFKNCYSSDYFSLKTAVVLTDLPTNTFMRGPGTTEGIASIEHIMEHIAFTVHKDTDYVRMINMKLEENDIPSLLNEIKKDADYEKRVKEIQQFNQANRWMKKAIKTSVMVFPLSYEGIFSAMISIYKVDGTVTVTTGGIEMGQGINTKVRQICAYGLGIPVEKVQVLANSTFTAANNALTARSVTSESVCFAVIKACNVIKDRLKPIKEKSPSASWKELITAAAKERIDLTVHYTITDKEPDLAEYNSYGVAILEVQLDVLTGRYMILRVDILEDVGLSANPLVDVGQVEGAFVQGLGYYTSEKLIYNQQTGRLLTNRTLNYQVPSSLDIPADFRVKLRYNSRNPKGVLGSKAVGEMGMCTSYVITSALRQCIYESRKDSGYDPSDWINIDIPFTTASILKALDVKLEEMVFAK